MRILFAASIPPRSVGGVGRSVSRLAEGMERRGHSVWVCDNSRGSSYLVFAVTVLLDALRRHADWVVARSTDGVLCAVWARVFGGMRVALHNHGWEEAVYEVERRLPHSIVTSPTTWKARMVRFPLLRFCLRTCNLCVCGAVSEARWLSENRGVVGRRLAVVPNGVDVRKEPFWDGRSPRPLLFLCVGAFTWKKNVEHALSVFAQILAVEPSARLFLVGSGTKELPPAAADVGGAVTCVPVEAPDAMDRWYRTCPFLFAVSRYEGGRSFAVLEAMSHGAVAFVSPIPSMLELVSDGRTGTVLSGLDPGRDAARVLDVVHNEDLVCAMGRCAFRLAVRHRWDRQVRRLEEALCRSR